MWNQAPPELQSTRSQILVKQFWRMIGRLGAPVLAGALFVAGCGDEELGPRSTNTPVVSDTMDVVDALDAGDPGSAQTDEGDQETETEEPQSVDGRPFIVDGSLRTSPVRAGSGWSAPSAVPVEHLTNEQRVLLSAHWTRAAQGEHASIASFSRFTLELLHLGAPGELVVQCADALRDEVRHARIALSMAAAYAGHSLAPGPLDISGSLTSSTDAATILRMTIQGGCINETLAIAALQAALSRTRVPAIQDILRDLISDESRHAALAWQTASWMIERWPALRPIAVQTFDEWELRPPTTNETVTAALEEHRRDPQPKQLEEQGYLSPAQHHAALRHAMKMVVEPCKATLLS